MQCEISNTKTQQFATCLKFRKGEPNLFQHLCSSPRTCATFPLRQVFPAAILGLCVYVCFTGTEPLLTTPILHPSEAPGGNCGLILMRSSFILLAALGIPPLLQELPPERVCVILTCKIWGSMTKHLWLCSYNWQSDRRVYVCLGSQFKYLNARCRSNQFPLWLS